MFFLLILTFSFYFSISSRCFLVFLPEAVVQTLNLVFVFNFDFKLQLSWELKSCPSQVGSYLLKRVPMKMVTSRACLFNTSGLFTLFSVVNVFIRDFYVFYLVSSDMLEVEVWS